MTEATVTTIPSLAFTRGVIVRKRAARETMDEMLHDLNYGEPVELPKSSPNMIVVRGWVDKTLVITIEGDEGGTVRLRAFPTRDLEQVLGNE
ncbi:MAG: hypothetical protein WDN04_13795 [Rhodospirillales bacterium]